MRFPDSDIDSVGELIARLREQTAPDHTIWFRGQARSSWQLTPSLARDSAHLTREMSLMKRFIQLAIPQMTDRIPLSSAEWEWVFLMQHHRMPTRLLDWSESPLTGLWFALNTDDPEDETHDASLWCIDPLALNRAAKLRGRWTEELPAFGRDDILNNYLPDRQKDGAVSEPIAAVASREFRRIVAQQGNFTISHSGSDPVDAIGDKTHVWRINVPALAKPKLREDLAYLRFTELLMFPDLDRAAKAALRSL